MTLACRIATFQSDTDRPPRAPVLSFKPLPRSDITFGQCLASPLLEGTSGVETSSRSHGTHGGEPFSPTCVPWHDLGALQPIYI
jgi:hypothetical protein